jgi:hypothetical protein
MNTNPKALHFRRYVVGVALLVVSSCDFFEQDALLPEKQVVAGQTEYFILPGTSVVIDLKSVIKDSYVNGSLRITQSPTRGNLTDLGEQLYRFTPNTNFTQGKDQFNVTVFSGTKVVRIEVLTIHLIPEAKDLPCGLIAVEDAVQTRIDEPIIIKFLGNDKFCGVQIDKIKASIVIEPKYGRALLFNDSIQYFPEIGYVGKDIIAYKVFEETVGDAASDQHYSHGIIAISIQDHQTGDDESPTIPKETSGKWKLLHSMSVVNAGSIFFTGDQVGMVGGTFNTLLKTNDGGVTWRDVSVEVEPGLCWSYGDVFFIDFNTGFLTATKHTEYPAISLDEWAIFKTMDGGESWQRMGFMESISLHH